MATPTRQASGVMSVEMEVTRYQEYTVDGMVQVWGYVGDYEVSICLEATDPRLLAILGKTRRSSPAERG